MTMDHRNRLPAYSGCVGSLPDAELVVAFLNTLDEEDHTDVLDDPALWLAWLTEHDGPPDTGAADAAVADPATLDAEFARSHRDALRTAVTDRAGELPAAAVRVRLDAGTPVLDAADPVGRVLAAAVRLAVAGEWDRVKICPADDCRWAFYDRSRNHSRTWCSMEMCGNRAKARQWRQRRRR